MASVWLACSLHQIWGNARVLLIAYAAIKGRVIYNALLKRARLIHKRWALLVGGGGGGCDVTWRSMQIAKTGSKQGGTELPGVMHTMKQVYCSKPLQVLISEDMFVKGQWSALVTISFTGSKTELFMTEKAGWATSASCLAPIKTSPQCRDALVLSPDASAFRLPV